MNHHLIIIIIALSRRSPTPLCHVFITASPRISFELTFTCAQAFDFNYKLWQKNAKSAHLKAAASESGDIGMCVRVYAGRRAKDRGENGAKERQGRG